LTPETELLVSETAPVIVIKVHKYVIQPLKERS